MAQKVPTRVSFISAVGLCFLTVFWPRRMEKLEAEDSKKLAVASDDNETRVRKVHRAFWTSLALIVGFAAVGVTSGLLLKCYCGSAPRAGITALQITGAALLLWGTLFVRGFEIQTFSSVTLGERVNQWLYRMMYCIGTAVVICSLAWTSTS